MLFSIWAPLQNACQNSLFFFFPHQFCSDKHINSVFKLLALICPWATTERTMLPIKEQEIITAGIENKTACQAMSTFKYYVTFLVFPPISHPQKGQGRTRKGSRKGNNSDQRDETASIRGTTKLFRTVQPGRDNLILYSYHGLEKVNSQWSFSYKS